MMKFALPRTSIALAFAVLRMPSASGNQLTEDQQGNERSIATEITVGAPVLFVTTQNAQGKSSSLSAFGYFIDGALCPLSKHCATISTHSHLDLKSGRQVFEGSDVGWRTFFLGEVDKANKSSEFYLAEQKSRLRLFTGVSLTQRNFDFRTVVEDKVDVFVGTRPTLEGAFWAYSIAVGGDLLLAQKYRLGCSVAYGQSVSSSVKNFKLSQLLINLRLLHLRL